MKEEMEGWQGFGMFAKVKRASLGEGLGWVTDREIDFFKKRKRKREGQK